MLVFRHEKCTVACHMWGKQTHLMFLLPNPFFLAYLHLGPALKHLFGVKLEAGHTDKTDGRKKKKSIL